MHKSRQKEEYTAVRKIQRKGGWFIARDVETCTYTAFNIRESIARNQRHFR